MRQALRYGLTLTLCDPGPLARAYNRIARELDTILRSACEGRYRPRRMGLLSQSRSRRFSAARAQSAQPWRSKASTRISPLADSSSTEYTRAQLQVFENCLRAVARRAACNSSRSHAAKHSRHADHALRLTTTWCGRASVFMASCPALGAPPPPDFRPAPTWKTTIGIVKTPPKGEARRLWQYLPHARHRTDRHHQRRPR